MRPERAWSGMRVRVRHGHRNRDLDGMVGTAIRSYSSSDRTAVDVRLEGGRWQLLWPEEVEDPTETRGK